MGCTPPRRIAALLFRRVGDCLLATPALRAVKQALPAAELTVVAESHVGRIFGGNPWIDNIEILHRAPSAFQLAAALRRRGVPDVTLDFLSDPRSAIASLLCGAGSRIGFAKRGRSLFYTCTVPLQSTLQPVYSAVHKLQIAAALDIHTVEFATEFQLTATDHDFAEAAWNSRGWSAADRVAAFFVHSRRAYKRWPLEHFANVLHLLQAQSNVKRLVLSTPDAGESIAELETHCALHASEKIELADLGRLGAVLARCAVLIGNDGGPKHIAVAIGTPTVTVFCHESPVYWTPPGDPLHTALGPAAFTPEQVFAAALPLLREQAT